ncbi:MAG: 16S rRNA (cytidine(1402)-2'-O)-methyltransferase [Lachnospiraceae bacterium]|nr:16S rRNA (cytidine(1402)-2'-O)-methyltransferase [Lachnospiraceae bacterium]
MEENKQGMLYLCATPIGNLGDLSPRIRQTLEEVDLIAAEDTRNSRRLLSAFDIHTPMTSYHEYNKTEKAYRLIDQMRQGKQIALITDAGTPGISDPGEVLVRLCQESGITVTSLPGPAACITALTLSGLSTRRFVFEGFLPENKKERTEVLEDLEQEKRTIILYAAPHDLKKVLSLLYEALGERRITICRELTKKFETVLPTTIPDAILKYETEEPRGEYVLVIEGKSLQEIEAGKAAAFDEISIAEHVAMYEKQGMERKDAMKKAAKDRGLSKRDVYQMLLEKEE